MNEFRVFGEQRIKYTVVTVADYKEIIDEIKASGGGRIWMETVRGERFSYLRVEQAVGLGAEVMVTTCPYCITHFEDSRLPIEDSESLVVKDITEIIQEAIWFFNPINSKDIINGQK